MKDKLKFSYHVATSSSVENKFHKLKNEDLRVVERPITADRFIIRHIKNSNKDSKLFRSKQLRHSCEDNGNNLLGEKRKSIFCR